MGTFLSAGILDRYARQRTVHAHGFFSACGRLFARMLRLNVLVWLVQAGVLWAYGTLAYGLYGWLTRDLGSERAALGWAILLLLPPALFVLAIVIVADCARVRLVVEDRRSALFALVAGGRFARRTAVSLGALYAMLIGTSAALMATYMLLAPGATWTGPWIWVPFAVGQTYVLARVAAKLLSYASVIALFQSALAHAEYVAYPAAVWPDAPAVETLGQAAAGTPPIDPAVLRQTAIAQGPDPH